MAAIARLTLVSLVAVVCLGLTQTQGQVEVVQSSGGLPAEVAGQFRSPSAFQQGPDGSYYVFDRQTQTVYLVSVSGQTTPIVEIGPEQGRIIGANAFDVGPDGRFVVADAPDGRERVQIFGADGSRLGGFTLPGRAAPRITLGSVTLSGVGSLHFTGRSIVMSQPELGGLVTQFSLDGQPFHTFGVFRATGHEDNRDVHLALNSGFPLSTSQGDFYFVFQAGPPIFRKFDARGQLRFERHIEGRELDGVIATLPNTWPKRADERGREFPVIPPTVRAAAVDQNDNLWVALTVPVVYVFDSDGEKIRTLRLQAAGPLHPDSLSFSNGNDLLVTPGCYRFEVW